MPPLKKSLYYKAQLIGIAPSILLRFGVMSGTRIFAKLLLCIDEAEVRVPEISHPVIVRVWTSDIVVFKQIFVDEIYRIEPDRPVRMIIDGGANVGYSSIYFAHHHNDATIISVEPEASNFDVLKRNCAPYANINPIWAAVWGSEESLHIVDPTVGKHAFRVAPAVEETPAALKSATISSLILNSDLRNVDFVKLDIEGSEKDVFSGSDMSWLDGIQHLIVEIHDDVNPGCTETVVSQCNAHGLRVDRTIGRNFFFLR